MGSYIYIRHRDVVFRIFDLRCGKVASMGNVSTAVIAMILLLGAVSVPMPAAQTHVFHGAGGSQEARASASSPQPAGMVNATVSQVVTSPATYGSIIQFSDVKGLPAGSVVGTNTTALTDSLGAVIKCSNQAYTVSSNGSISSFSLSLLGNASEGPFTLDGTTDTASFRIPDAGIASVPSGKGSAIFVSPGIQSTSGSISVYGSDFLQSQNVGYPVVGNQSYANAGNEVADSNGAFHLEFQLDSLPAGNYTVRMSGAIQVTTALTVVPGFQLIPGSGHVGQSVIASLSGFAPGSTVTVSWGSSYVKSARTSTQGGAIIVIDVPALSFGPHTVYANSSAFSSEATFMLNASSIILSSYGAVPGSTVNVYAEGFHAMTGVHLIYEGRALGQPVETADNGTAILPFNVPEMTAGTYRIHASSSDGMSSNETTFTVKPTILSSKENVYVGSHIEISGRFYYPSTSIKIYIGSILIPGTFKSSSNGTFYTNITVPAVPGGRIAIGAYDTEGNNASVFTMQVMPRLYISSDTGSSGSKLLLGGNGFAPGSMLTVMWNGEPVAYGVNVAANGTFSTMLTVPDGIPGSYLISVGNSTAAPLVFNLAQYTGFSEFLPAILLPLVTAVVAALYLFGRFRVRRQ